MPSDEMESKILDELEKTLDYQIQAIQNFEDKAFRLLRMDLVILGAVFTAFSVAPSLQMPIERFVNLFTITGFGFLLLSIIGSAVGFTAISYDMGISDAVIDRVQSFDRQQEYREMMLNLYSNWIEHNSRTQRINVTIMSISMISFVISIIQSIAGIIIVFARIDTGLLFYAIYLGTMLFSVLIWLLIWHAESVFRMSYNM